jgi:hypothetical protein
VKKQEIVTFKVDEQLFKVIQEIPNRSEFIRSAILTALDSICPLCNGSGTLSPNQKQHWNDFSERHSVQTCGDCNERHLVCCLSQDSQ